MIYSSQRADEATSFYFGRSYRAWARAPRAPGGRKRATQQAGQYEKLQGGRAQVPRETLGKLSKQLLGSSPHRCPGALRKAAQKRSRQLPLNSPHSCRLPLRCSPALAELFGLLSGRSAHSYPGALRKPLGKVSRRLSGSSAHSCAKALRLAIAELSPQLSSAQLSGRFPERCPGASGRVLWKLAAQLPGSSLGGWSEAPRTAAGRLSAQLSRSSPESFRESLKTACA